MPTFIPVETPIQSEARASEEHDLRPSLAAGYYYVDLNPGIEQADGPILLFDKDALREKIANVLSTLPGSEVFEPLFGSELPYRLFEPFGEITAFSIEFDTILALTNQMRSEIYLLHGLCNVSEASNEEGYNVEIAYADLNGRINDRFGIPLSLPPGSLAQYL